MLPGVAALLPPHAPAERCPAEGAQGEADVGEVGIGVGHPAEQLTGARDVAGPLDEVGERVRQPEMVRPHALRRLLPGLEQLDRPVQLAAIRQRAGGDDAALRSPPRRSVTPPRAPSRARRPGRTASAPGSSRRAPAAALPIL